MTLTVIASEARNHRTIAGIIPASATGAAEDRRHLFPVDVRPDQLGRDACEGH